MTLKVELNGFPNNHSVKLNIYFTIKFSQNRRNLLFFSNSKKSKLNTNFYLKFITQKIDLN